MDACDEYRRDRLKLFAYKNREDPSSRIFVFWSDDKKLSTSTMKTYPLSYFHMPHLTHKEENSRELFKDLFIF